jgi:hypothetical protein
VSDEQDIVTALEEEIAEISSLDDLHPDAHNANLGTSRGQWALRESLARYGPGRSVLTDRKGRIVSGNKTVETVRDLGGMPIYVVRTPGDGLVVHQREDLDLEEDGGVARSLAYADNRTSELNLAWDAGQIAADIEEGLDIVAFFQQREVDQLMYEALSAEEQAIAEEADDATIPEMELQPFEHYDYVMLVFRTTWDWARAIEVLGIGERAFSYESSKGNLRRKVGLCRVMDGTRFLEILQQCASSSPVDEE